jgi:D-sedoheptulose 7-phosphate isomerase
MFIAARVKKIKTILLTGAKNGCCREFADEVIAVPDTETYRIQELHLPVYHALCLTLESCFFEMME